MAWTSAGRTSETKAIDGREVLCYKTRKIKDEEEEGAVDVAGAEEGGVEVAVVVVRS